MQFYNKDGSLSVYALACGYVQNYDRDDIYTKMWATHNVFFVRTWSPLAGKPVEASFHRVSEARQAFRRQAKLTLKDLEAE